MQENQFIEAIRLAPHDIEQRVRYADWLDEQQDLRADFVRLQLKMEQWPRYSPNYEDVLRDTYSYFVSNSGDWDEPLHWALPKF